MENKQTEKTKKKPFKQTRGLVRLALNNGWTQTEIAKTCRTHQSVVSAWSKGEKLGTEQKLKPLLDLFGYKLRRNTFKLYWHKNKETSKIEFIKVEGKIIFSLLIGKQNCKKFAPKYKFVIHHQGNENVHMIFKQRTRDNHDKGLEAATWGTVFNSPEPISVNRLLKICDELSSKSIEHFDDKHKILRNKCDCWVRFICEFPEYAQSLPFLVRQALLNHGFPVNDIIEYPASW